MLPGFIFWCDYNYFNSYLDIYQDTLKNISVKSVTYGHDS